jgi:hypothetical protein
VEIAVSTAVLLTAATIVCVWFFGQRLLHAAIAYLAGAAAAGSAAAPILHGLLAVFAHH